ncbi:hypothetical protein FC756_25165, partial [Lysinibacillus mangiferihumi]
MIFFKRIPHFFMFLTIVLLICGCTNEDTKSKDINYKVLVDKLEEDINIVSPLYYQTINGASKVWLWKDKKIVNSSTEDFVYPFFEAFPTEPLKRLEAQLDIHNSIEEEYGQWFFYDNTENYEVFIFDSWNNKENNDKEWQVFFLNDELKQITIEKESIYMELAGHQVTENEVYIYSSNKEDIIVYKIDVATFEMDKYTIPFSLFNVSDLIMNVGQFFIQDNTFILSTSDFTDSNGKNNNGVFLVYDFNTKKAETIFIDHGIYKVFPYNDEFIVLSSDENNNTYLKSYDQAFNLIESKKIDIKSEQGSMYVRKNLWQVNDDKLYGTMSIDGLNIDYLVVIDINNAEVLYQMELINVNHKSQ